ncbi:MAG: IS200/IS605 family accessory protein TnpB-related protein [Bacillota bacterium]
MPKPKRKKEDKFRVTVCGEWFPEAYPELRSEKWARGDEDPLETEMRLFCACGRWAFNRLPEGVSRDKIKKRGQELFGLNSRYADDARLKAQALLDSQRELLEMETEATGTKLGRARKRLGQAMRKLAEAGKKGAAPQVLQKLRLAVKGRNDRVASLEQKLTELRAHQENGTVPPVVFGGRKLWKRVSKGRGSREEWRAARKSRLYSRGDETKGGNPNVKVSHAGGEFRLAVSISHLSEQIGEDAKGRPKMTRAPRVEGRLWLPEKHRGRYLVHLSFELAGAPEPDFGNGCLGLDINPDGVALCNVGRTGQPEPWPGDFGIASPPNLGKYEGEFRVILYPNGFAYIRIPDLEYARGFRRKYLIGVLAKVIVDAARLLGKPIGLEDLDFGKDRLDTDAGFNRMASNFPYAQATEAVCRRAAKEQVAFKPVPPRHTSAIGLWKYMDRFAVPVHCAAALVVGRRAMGYRERVTKELKELVARIGQTLARKGRSEPREGTGMTRGVRACLRQLERKMQVHNALPAWEQTRFCSVWRDFRLLALSLR